MQRICLLSGGIRKKGRMLNLRIRPFATVWRWVVPIETDLFIERAAASSCQYFAAYLDASSRALRARQVMSSHGCCGSRIFMVIISARMASISLTSITGMPSTLAFFTEFNTRAWESTAVRVSPLFSMAAGRCALTSTLIDLGNCLETLASLTPGMDLSCSVTSWVETRNNDFPACLSAMAWMVCALTHSLAPDTPISLVSRRNTDEKSSSHASPVTTATLTTAINTRNATTRTFARLRSLARSVKFTTFGRDATPREPVV